MVKNRSYRLRVPSLVAKENQYIGSRNLMPTLFCHFCTSKMFVACADSLTEKRRVWQLGRRVLDVFRAFLDCAPLVVVVVVVVVPLSAMQEGV